LGITDEFGVTMACLNYSGMMIANAAIEADEDAYENESQSDMHDDNAQRRKHSNIEFRPFSEWKNMKPWTYMFKNGESVECMAIGTSWCGVLTSHNYIRVFSHSGIQKHIICQGTPVVTMAGYESLLAVVYHAGPSVLNCQTMRVKIVNMANRDYRVLMDTEFPISRNANLIWLSFSEEGQLCSFDTEGVVRAFTFQSQQWSPIYDFKQSHAEVYNQVWIVGVMDGEILAIIMP
jgi:chromosome transmission fidelity protein 4